MSYNVIYKHYESCFDKHGDSHLGVDWPIKDDVDKRFDIMLNVIKDNNKKVSILDFGCGCGHLLEYIQKKKLNIQFH